MALQYSRLGFNGENEPKSWNNIVLSPTTVGQRKQIKNGMDDFMSFTWRGVDAFDTFGAFIINNKGTLKFYNGPTFSNEYTKPQFESAAGQLVGVSFNVQKIDFTIGIYWISEDDYRKLIDWLNPYEISTLTFGFEPQYYYIAKIASIGDAMRRVVGCETIEGQKEYRYYTEIKLTFEIQGDPCAYRKIQYEFEGASENDESTDTIYKYTYTLKDISDNNFKSHLAMPFKYKMHIALDPIDTLSHKILYVEGISYYNNFSDTRLFYVAFKNLSYTDLTAEDGHYYLDIIYDSATGLLYWDRNNSKLFLLSRLSTASSGSRIVDTLNSTSYKIPGTFDNWDFDIQNWKLELTITSSSDNDEVAAGIADPHLEDDDNYYIEMRARTNLI